MKGLRTQNQTSLELKQEDMFVKVKTELTAHSILVLHDPQSDTKDSVDASSHDLDALILHKKQTGMGTSGLCFLINVRDRD